MNGESTVDRLGSVQPLFERAEIMEIREDKGKRWAIFHISVTRGDDSGMIQILDCRPDTLVAAEKALAISNEYFKARGKAKKEMGDSRLNALWAARTALSDSPADAVTRHQVMGGGKNERLTIILYPTSDKPTRIMTVVQTTGWYQRLPYEDGLTRPIRYTKGRRGFEIYYHAHLVVTANPVMIWQLQPDQPILFKISLSDGVKTITFAPVKPEEKLSPEEPAAPTADPVKPAPVTPAAAKNNGNRTINCDKCGTDNNIKRTAKTAHCTKCKAALDLTT